MTLPIADILARARTLSDRELREEIAQYVDSERRATASLKSPKARHRVGREAVVEHYRQARAALENELARRLPPP